MGTMVARESDLTISGLAAVFLRTVLLAPPLRASPFPFACAARTSFEAISAAGFTLVSSLIFLGALGFAMFAYSLNSWLGMIGDKDDIRRPSKFLIVGLYLYYI